MPFTPERVALVSLFTVVVIFGVHSFIDFTWFVPGNALPALLAAGFLAGRGPLGAGQPLPRPLRWRVHHGLRDPVRVTGAVAAIALALVASWAVLGPQRSANAGQDALALLDKGDVDGARQKVQEARDLNPLTVEPLFELSVIEQRATTTWPRARRSSRRCGCSRRTRGRGCASPSWSSTCSTARRSRSTRSGPRCSSTRGTRRRSTRSSTLAGRLPRQKK